MLERSGFFRIIPEDGVQSTEQGFNMKNPSKCVSSRSNFLISSLLRSSLIIWWGIKAVGEMIVNTPTAPDSWKLIPSGHLLSHSHATAGPSRPQNPKSQKNLIDRHLSFALSLGYGGFKIAEAGSMPLDAWHSLWPRSTLTKPYRVVVKQFSVL